MFLFLSLARSERERERERKGGMEGGMEGGRESDYRHDAGRRKRTLLSLFLSHVVNKLLSFFEEVVMDTDSL